MNFLYPLLIFYIFFISSISIVNIGWTFSGTGYASITVGQSVTWTVNDGSSHTVTSTDGSGELSSGTLSSPSSYTHTFNSPGTFTYHCAFHSSMTGTITVSAVSVPPSSS